jgi:hypothetical protein
MRSPTKQTAGEGSKADKPDARKLAELLLAGLLRPAYHRHEATRELKELVRGDETLSADTQRMMVRIKAIYRAQGIRTPGTAVYQQKQGSNGCSSSPQLEADSA